MSNAKIYLIKDIARMTGLSVFTIKYYLKLELIKEVSRSPETNFRYFNDDTVRQLRAVMDQRKQGFSLRKIKELLAPKAT